MCYDILSLLGQVVNEQANSAGLMHHIIVEPQPHPLEGGWMEGGESLYGLLLVLGADGAYSTNMLKTCI